MQVPTKLLEDLEMFYTLVRTGMKMAAYSSWLTNIREDLGVITDARIRQQAFQLFVEVEVERAGYVIQRHPEMRQDVVLPAIQRLIDYLRKASAA